MSNRAQVVRDYMLTMGDASEVLAELFATYPELFREALGKALLAEKVPDAEGMVPFASVYESTFIAGPWVPVKDVEGVYSHLREHFERRDMLRERRVCSVFRVRDGTYSARIDSGIGDTTGFNSLQEAQAWCGQCLASMEDIWEDSTMPAWLLL